MIASIALMASVAFAPVFSPQQAEAATVMATQEVRELLYGGARGGGKSWFGCVWSFMRAVQIAHEFDLSPHAHPPVVGFMGRKQSVDFRTTTLETWKQVIPAAAYVIKEQAQEIVIGGTVKIRYGGLDRSEDVQKFNSAELSFVFIDQAEEITRDDVMALRGAMRQRLRSEAVATKILFTANPAPSWLREEFIPDRPGGAQRFVRALPTDNPMLPEGYIDQLKLAYKHRPELLKAMVEGDWFCFGGTSQVIRDADVITAQAVVLRPDRDFVLLACDPARMGDDQTVIYAMRNTQIEGEEIYGRRDTPYTANRLFQLHRDLGGCPVAIDATGGIGGNIAGQLARMGVDVIEFEFGGRSSDPTHYANIRAEIWWRAGELFAAGLVQLRDTDHWRLSDTLRGDLTSPQYAFVAGDGKITIENKGDIKGRIGRSPDEGDAYVVGLAGLEFLRDHRYASADGVRFRKGIPQGERVVGPPRGSMAWFKERDREAETQQVSRW